MLSWNCAILCVLLQLSPVQDNKICRLQLVLSITSETFGELFIKKKNWFIYFGKKTYFFPFFKAHDVPGYDFKVDKTHSYHFNRDERNNKEINEKHIRTNFTALIGGYAPPAKEICSHSLKFVWLFNTLTITTKFNQHSIHGRTKIDASCIISLTEDSSIVADCRRFSFVWTVNGSFWKQLKRWPTV